MVWSQLFAAPTAQGAECIKGLCDTGLPVVAGSGAQVLKIIQIVLAVVGMLALIYIIIAGFQMVTSLGNPEALTKLRQSIIFTAVGLAIILSAELIVSLVISRI